MSVIYLWSSCDELYKNWNFDFQCFWWRWLQIPKLRVNPHAVPVKSIELETPFAAPTTIPTTTWARLLARTNAKEQVSFFITFENNFYSLSLNNDFIECHCFLQKSQWNTMASARARSESPSSRHFYMILWDKLYL